MFDINSASIFFSEKDQYKKNFSEPAKKKARKCHH